MGKRELLLAAAFVVVGLVVYQFTAPPPDPNSRGFSFSRIIDGLRREVRGNSETAEVTQTLTRRAPATLSEIRIRLSYGAITVVGEDRADIAAELKVRANGYDKPEAESRAKAAAMKFDEAGSVLIVSMEGGREGLRPALTLKVPSRLAVRVEDKNGELVITNVASVSMGLARAATTISNVKGAVTLTQRGNAVTIGDVGSLKLSTVVGAKARVSQVRGDATFSLQTGELRAEGLAGGLEVDSRNAELHFEKLDALKGPVRVNANLGKVTFVGLKADARIDGRETEIRVSQAAPAPLAIYNEGEEPTELTTPPAGFKLDVLAVNGKVTLDPGLEQAGLRVVGPPDGAQPADTRRETRVNGSVAGGGPTLTVRSIRGDIVLRSK